MSEEISTRPNSILSDGHSIGREMRFQNCDDSTLPIVTYVVNALYDNRNKIEATRLQIISLVEIMDSKEEYDKNKNKRIKLRQEIYILFANFRERFF